MPSSKLYDNEIVINDENYEKYVQEGIDGNNGRGLRVEMRGTADYAYDGYASPFSNSLLIDPSDYQAIIEEQEEQKSRISDLITLQKLPSKDQKQTNYCWIFAPTHCVEICRLQQNQTVVDLSPASVGAKIKSYRNVGGWGKEGLEGIIKWGCYPTSLWPATAIDRKYDTAAGQQEALKYRIDEWIECIPRNKAQMISMLLRRKPGAAGLNWWGHEVTFCECIWLDGQVAIRFRNSWGAGYGSNGFSVLQGSKILADDLVFPMTALAT